MMLVHVQFMFSHFWPLPLPSRMIREATASAVSLPVLCELVLMWPRLFAWQRLFAWRWLFGLLVQRWKLAWSRRRLVEASSMGSSPLRGNGWVDTPLSP